MTDVFEEVEEELRSEQWRKIARRWLPVAGVVLAVCLAAALGYWAWDSWRTRQAEAASLAYNGGVEALQRGDLAAAESAFNDAAERGGAYKVLALNQRAAIALQSDRIEDAVALLDEAADSTRDPVLKDLSRLKAALLLLDTAPLDALTDRLEPLAEDGRPYAAFAQEALGMARIQNNQMQAARELFVQLSLGQDVPEGVRQRAQAAIQAIDSGTASAIPAIAAAAREAAEAPVQAPTAPEAAAPIEAPAQIQEPAE
ncbi:tetratricopeptide repeat protein [Brevundimonas balnearis]|uniref:Ancillary SecYEG translocon subunit n=1 Tax=Brevundimonas balnearis TaxID=1572858 RepID=A0ABV6R4F6_9CAUL